MINKLDRNEVGVIIKRRLLLATGLVGLITSLICSGTATFGESIQDYFNLSYQVSLTTTEVHGTETFYAAATGSAVCKKELPLVPSSVKVTASVVATHQATAREVTLNSNYQVTLSPIPDTVGESTTITQAIPLSFPADSQPGDYTVTGKLISAVAYLGIIPMDVTSMLPQTQTIGVVRYLVDSTPPSGGGGGPPANTQADVTSTSTESEVSPVVTCFNAPLNDQLGADGITLQPVEIVFREVGLVIKMDRGMKCLAEDGRPLTEITVTPVSEPPAPPSEAELIYAFDFGPDGATFSPPMKLLLDCSEQLRRGIKPEQLRVAFWDEVEGKWVNLSGTVDLTESAISCEVSHFTVFALIVYERPAVFSLTNLLIIPDVSQEGQLVRITADLENTGGIEGEYTVRLLLNDSMVNVKTFKLPAGEKTEVSFEIMPPAGRYLIDLNGMNAWLEVTGNIGTLSTGNTAVMTSSISTEVVSTAESPVFTTTITAWSETLISGGNTSETSETAGTEGKNNLKWVSIIVICIAGILIVVWWLSVMMYRRKFR